MTTQFEQQLEKYLIDQLQKLASEPVGIDDETALIANLKTQVEMHNNTELCDAEFNQVLNKLA